MKKHSFSGKIEKLDLVSRTFAMMSLDHGGPVRALVLDPAGTRLFSGGDDGRIRRWGVDPSRRLVAMFFSNSDFERILF